MKAAPLDTRIVLAGYWIAVMLVYLLGDVLRIFAGHATPGKVQGVEITQAMWLGISVLMLLPIVMVVLSLTLTGGSIRTATLIVAGFLIVFNLLGLPYKGMYDNFLIVVSIAFKSMILWQAWYKLAVK